MMISQELIQKILGIEEQVLMSPIDMANSLSVTFFPNPDNANISNNIRLFSKKLEETLIRLGVKVIPYKETLYRPSIFKMCNRFVKYLTNNIIWVFRKIVGKTEINFYLPFTFIVKFSFEKKIKKGVSIICLGEQDINNLQMEKIASFKTNSVITVIDFPNAVNEDSTFSSHFDTAMDLFAYHMTNIVISVDSEKFMLYNFNASHPIYKFNDGKFDNHILKALIPKIVAPISPHKFRDFIVHEKTFDTEDVFNKEIINAFITGAKLFEKTNLYPKGKRIDDLPFRHSFHKLIGKMHLDNRSGMSFGFLAFQMPTKVENIVTLDDFRSRFPDSFNENEYYFDNNGYLYLFFKMLDKMLVMKIPDVWVLTLRSGSDKTNFDKNKDLLKLGLCSGKMYMQFPNNLKVDRDYRPSFDTKVILAHAVGNAMIASIAKYIDGLNDFSQIIETKGISISHWHGYFNKEKTPKNVSHHGHNNLHVACSSPQSAVYALDGKLKSFVEKMNASDILHYRGDIHVEPHHGVNISFPSLSNLAEYIISNPDVTELGNKYLSE